MSRIRQYIGAGKNHRNLDVKPLALFWLSAIMGIAVWGWVNPTRVKEVCSILKFALLVTIKYFKRSVSRFRLIVDMLI